MAMTDRRPWETQTAAEMRTYAESAGIDLSHLPAKAAKREIYAAIMQGLTAAATAVVAEVDESLELTAAELVAEHTGNDDDLTEVDAAAQTLGMTDAEKRAAYRAMDRLHDEAEDEARTEEAMRRWKTPDEDDVDVLDVARERAAEKSLLPTLAQWNQIEVMGDTLAEGRMVKAKQLGTPADVKLILLAGRDLGIPPTMAVQQIHVIDGKPSLSAQLMVALVRNAGYSIIPTTMTAERAVAKGTRGDEVVEFEFTIEEAAQAGLANKDNWKHYPKAMCWSRAVSGLCRVLFPDVLAGLTYTPEELGGEDWGDAPVKVEATASIDALPADPPLDDLEKAKVRAHAESLPEADRDRMKAEWARLKSENILRPLDHLRESDRPALAGLLRAFPVPSFEPAPEADEMSDDAPGGEDEGVTYATGQGERTVTSSLLNEPEDAVTVCPDCGGPSGKNVECMTCMEEPF